MKANATNHKEKAECILTLCGGKKNIHYAEHCATRLRLKFVDNSLVDKNALKRLPYVSGIIERAQCSHIVLGTDIFEIYPFFMELCKLPHK